MGQHRQQHQKNIEWQITRMVPKGKSDNTAKGKKTTIHVIAEAMKSYGLQDIHSMKTKHVDRFVADITKSGAAMFGSNKPAKGVKGGQLAQYLTVLRDIAEAIGKQNIVARDNKTYEATRSDEVRHNPKALDRDNYAAALDKLSEHKYGEQFVLAKTTGDAIGARLREKLVTRDIAIKDEEGHLFATRHASKELSHVSDAQMQARYKASITNYTNEMKPGVPYAIVEFPKNGQRRAVPLDTPEKLFAMEMRQQYIREHGLRSLLPADKVPERGIKSFSNALRRAGFTKENMCNDHLGRHDFGQKEYAVGKSAREIMEEFGHHRLAELRSYVHL